MATPQSTTVSTSVEYRDIPGFPGYRVGDDGSVWTCRKTGYGRGRMGEWKRLKATPDKAGRPTVGVSRDRRQHRKVVSWIVAEVFIGPRPQGLLVCHDDGNPANNRPSNLKYGTHKDNEDDKERHGRRLRGDRHPVAKLNADKVRDVRVKLAAGWVLNEIARFHGVDGAIISRIRDGKAWKWVI